MSFDFAHHPGGYRHLLLALRSEVCGSYVAGIAVWSAIARSVLRCARL